VEYFYKIIIYLKQGKPITTVKRLYIRNRGDVEEQEFKEANRLNPGNVHKVDAWLLDETDPDVIAYKRQWL